MSVLVLGMIRFLRGCLPGAWRRSYVAWESRRARLAGINRPSGVPGHTWMNVGTRIMRIDPIRHMPAPGMIVKAGNARRPVAVNHTTMFIVVIPAMGVIIANSLILATGCIVIIAFMNGDAQEEWLTVRGHHTTCQERGETGKRKRAQCLFCGEDRGDSFHDCQRLIVWFLVLDYGGTREGPIVGWQMESVLFGVGT